MTYLARVTLLDEDDPTITENLGVCFVRKCGEKTTDVLPVNAIDFDRIEKYDIETMDKYLDEDYICHFTARYRIVPL